MITTGTYRLYTGSPAIIDPSLAYVVPLRVTVEGMGYYLTNSAPANMEVQYFQSEGRLQFFEEPDTPADMTYRNVFVKYKV